MLLLMTYSYLAARRHALDAGPRLLSTAVGGGLGVLLILLKSLH